MMPRERMRDVPRPRIDIDDWWRRPTADMFGDPAVLTVVLDDGSPGQSWVWTADDKASPELATRPEHV